ncbi:Glycerol-3-phosphate phosphatase [Camponotus japonicus]
MSAINIKTLSCENVLKFLRSFDTVLTDCDGVLWLRTTPLPNSSNVMNLFRKFGKQVFYVTNNSTKTRDDLVEKCRALKFQANKDDILCTANLSACYLQSLSCKKTYVIGSEAIARELEQVGISYHGIGPDVINPNTSYSAFEKDPEVTAVIVGLDKHFSYPKMVKAATYLNDTNVHFIGTNTDERFPNSSSDVVIPGTGSLVRCIESCAERKAVIMGKPDNYMVTMLMERSNIDPQRTLMIGDRCNTDILLGTRCGFITLLVLTGVTALSDVEKWKQSEHQEERDLVPNYYIDALGDLLPYLKELESEIS